MDFPLRRVLHAPLNGTAYSNGVTDLKLPASRTSSPLAISRPMTPTSHEENLHGGWVVQKFGGTSVGKFAKNIAKDIVSAGLKDNRLAVVCSARSSSTKEKGTTNRLLRSADAARRNDRKAFETLIAELEKDHITTAQEQIESREILADLTEHIKTTCNQLRRILESALHLGEVSSGTEDKIASKGEALACRFMTALLQDVGVEAVFLDMSEIIPKMASGTAPRLDEEFYAHVAALLGERIRAKCGSGETSEGDPGIVPVITGYFGRVPGGLLNTVGRGYTDLCASLVAVGLSAKELQVWKEVDGIFTADPRKVPTARLLDAVTPSEAAELTFYGSEVIHPFTMEQVIRASIPIRIKNVKNPRNKGTMIFPDPEPSELSLTSNGTSTPPIQGSLRLLRKRLPSSNNVPRQKPKRPTAVTVKHNCVILNVHSNKKTRAHGFLMNIFKVLDNHGLTVDLLSSSEVHVSMALHSDKVMISSSSDEIGADDESEEAAIDIRDQYLLAAVQELQLFGTIDLINHMAIVSLVGKQLRNMVGISGRFLKTLGDNNINIEMISQGASEINISCVIDEREADRALNVVHTSLFTFLD